VKKLTLALLAAIALLTGCTPDTTPGQPRPVAREEVEATTAAPAPTPEPSPVEDITGDDLYIALLDLGEIYYSSPGAAIEAGQAVCDALDEGNSLMAIGTVIADSGGYTFDEAGYIIGSAVQSYCTEYDGIFE